MKANVHICSHVQHIALPHEQLYISRMPSAEMYEKSYMHRDAINFVAVTRYGKSNIKPIC